VLESEATELLRQIGAKSKVTTFTGTFVSYDATGCVVDIGDGRIPAALGSGYLPETGEQVLVWFVDGAPYVMGPSTPRPHSGTVATVASGLVTVNTPVGVTDPLPYVGSAPAVGAAVRIIWGNGGGIVFTATPATGIPTPPPPPPVTTKRHTDTFNAIGAGTWNTGGGDSATSYFNSEVWASNTTIGFWFYGTKVPDTIPAGAKIERVQLYIAARQIFGGAPVFTTHNRAGAPGISLSGGSAIGVSNYQWIDLPVSFGNALRRGGGAYGIGTRHGGYNIFKSLAADGQSGALRITSVY